MRKALRLLEDVTRLYPLEQGAHNLVRENYNLVLNLKFGSRWARVIFFDSDLDKEGHELILEVKRVIEEIFVVYEHAFPCDHPGCQSHQTHPCEGCGRIGANGLGIAKKEGEWK